MLEVPVMALTDQEVEKPYRTASEVVMTAMESFSEHEPKGVLIIHTDASGAVVLTANTNKVYALGLIETAKNMILNGEV